LIGGLLDKLNKQNKLCSYTFAAYIFLLIVVIIVITEITSEKYAAYGSGSWIGSASINNLRLYLLILILQL
jgi:hypothetical protein